MVKKAVGKSVKKAVGKSVENGVLVNAEQPKHALSASNGSAGELVGVVEVYR